MWFLFLLAESSTGLNDIGNVLLGTAGGGAFSIWYGWYMTTKTIPDLQATAREDAKTQSAAHRADVKGIVDKFDATLKEQRDEHRKEMDVFWAELKEEREARRQDTITIVDAVRRLSPPSLN